MENIRSRSKRFCMHGRVHVLCVVRIGTTSIPNCTFIYTILHIVYSADNLCCCCITSSLSLSVGCFTGALQLCDGVSSIDSNQIYNARSNDIIQWFGVITRGVRCLLISAVLVDYSIFLFWGGRIFRKH